VLDVIIFILVGFLAQMIDGTLGMAYGVSSTSFLLTLGLTPAVASASVHTSEVFTTLASGLSHLKVGNVDKRLLKRLLIPGSVSAVVGAYLLVNVPLQLIKPAVQVYLGTMGVAILLRARGVNLFMRRLDQRGLAILGGFMDAVGGGGWGPIVTSTLIANGEEPKTAIGSVNAAEFFITISQSITFLLLLGLQNLTIILGLLAGGVVAAPLGAILCKKAPRRGLMLLVGALILCLSLKNLLQF
jgi:hypothetical protein